MLANTNQLAVQYNKRINKKIIEICTPLFENFGFTYFTYVRFMPNKKRLYITSSQEWIELYVDRQMQNDPKHEEKVMLPVLDKKYVLWNSHETNDVFYAGRQLGRKNGIYIHQKNEMYMFAPKPDKQDLINLCISNQSILNHFIFYFKSHATDMLYSEEAEKCMLVSKYEKLITETEEEKRIKNFFKDTLLKKFYLIHNARKVSLSRREVECLLYLAKGKPTGVAAKLMGIGTRTVEFYLNNIKEKLDCFSKAHVIEVFSNSPLGALTIGDLYA